MSMYAIISNHRLTQLEKRMDVVEGKMDQLVQICTRIETGMQTCATKESVWKVMALGVGMAVLTLVGHAAMRAWI